MACRPIHANQRTWKSNPQVELFWVEAKISATEILYLKLNSIKRLT